VKKIVGVLLVAMFVVVALTTFYVSYQDEKQNLSGYVKVKHSPNITAIELFDDDDRGTTTPTSELTPNDEMTIRITVDLIDPTEIYSVDVVIYHNLAGFTAPDNASHHATIHWDKDVGSWSISPSGTTWDVDGINSSVPLGTQVGTIHIYVVFTPGKIARYSATGNWVIYAKVTDTDNPTLLYDEDQLTGLNCKYYLEMHVDAVAFDFGSVPPGCTNVSFNYTGGINVSVITNYWWRLTLNATGWYNTTDDLVVDFSTFDSILADDDPIPDEAPSSETGLAPFWVKPSGSYWDSLSPPTDDLIGTVIHLYLFVTLPSDIDPGDYHTTLSVITAQSAP